MAATSCSSTARAGFVPSGLTSPSSGLGRVANRFAKYCRPRQASPRRWCLALRFAWTALPDGLHGGRSVQVAPILSANDGESALPCTVGTRWHHGLPGGHTGKGRWHVFARAGACRPGPPCPVTIRAGSAHCPGLARLSLLRTRSFCWHWAPRSPIYVFPWRFSGWPLEDDSGACGCCWRYRSWSRFF